MAAMNQRMMFLRPGRSYKTSNLNKANGGFTVIEMVMSVVIVGVVSLGVLAGYNFSRTSSGVIKEIASENALVEEDKARIYDLAERFSACTSPSGSLLATSGECDNLSQINSHYYSPSNLDWDSFFTACNNDTITNNFIALIDALPQPGGGVVRTAAQKEKVNSTSEVSYLVRVEWTLANSDFTRILKLRPFVGSWCN